jgi:hypothetical protein
MLKTLPLAALVLALAAAIPARAEDKAGCGDVPRDQWLTQDAIKAKAEGLGFQVRQVKVENGCYELYAIDKNGAKIERYLNPVTGEPVNIEDAD